MRFMVALRNQIYPTDVGFAVIGCEVVLGLIKGFAPAYVGHSPTTKGKV